MTVGYTLELRTLRTALHGIPMFGFTLRMAADGSRLPLYVRRRLRRILRASPMVVRRPQRQRLVTEQSLRSHSCLDRRPCLFRGNSRRPTRSQVNGQHGRGADASAVGRTARPSASVRHSFRLSTGLTDSPITLSCDGSSPPAPSDSAFGSSCRPAWSEGRVDDRLDGRG